MNSHSQPLPVKTDMNNQSEAAPALTGLSRECFDHQAGSGVGRTQRCAATEGPSSPLAAGARGLLRAVGLWSVLVLLLAGCSTSNLSRLDKVPPDQAIAVAKFRVLYNGKDASKGCNVIFNNREQCPILDATGYVFAKLPVGTNSIRNLVHKSGLMQHHFPAGELACQLRGDGVINYLGDVTIVWDGMGSGAGLALAAFSPLLNSATTGGKAQVAVESNPAAAQEAVRRKFSTERSLEPSLLVVKPNQ